ncbi:MAG: family 1 encapsulin nanocompartment shell protein [Bacteroidota bacterium]
MDILRKSFAPISEQAWEEINEEAKNILSSALSARRFVDVDGPHGIDKAAVTVGELDIPARQAKTEVQYGVHKVMPLVEARIPFSLNIWELDNLSRGSEDIDLDNLQAAAKKIAAFEEKAIYDGFAKANITGLIKASEHPKMKVGSMDNFMDIITKAMFAFRAEGIEGKFNLVAGHDLYQKIFAQIKGYPLKKHLKDVIGGEIILSDNIKGGLLVADDEDAFRLTLGQDLSIGYEAHDQKEVHLYMTESFTFEVLDPAAVIVFE